MKKQFVKPEIKGIRLRSNILAGSGGFNGGGNVNGVNQPSLIKCNQQPDNVIAICSC